MGLRSIKGFTLIELLVVLLIIGLIASLALPSLPQTSDYSALRKQQLYFKSLVELQSEEAILTGTQRGLVFKPKGDQLHYSWLLWYPVERQWGAIVGNDPRFDGSFVNIKAYTLLVEGQLVNIEETNQGVTTPQLVLYSSGDITEFELILVAGEEPVESTLQGGYAGLKIKDEAGDA